MLTSPKKEKIVLAINRPSVSESKRALHKIVTHCDINSSGVRLYISIKNGEFIPGTVTATTEGHCLDKKDKDFFEFVPDDEKDQNCELFSAAIQLTHQGYEQYNQNDTIGWKNWS